MNGLASPSLLLGEFVNSDSRRLVLKIAAHIRKQNRAKLSSHCSNPFFSPSFVIGGIVHGTPASHPITHAAVQASSKITRPLFLRALFLVASLCPCCQPPLLATLVSGSSVSTYCYHWLQGQSMLQAFVACTGSPSSSHPPFHFDPAVPSILSLISSKRPAILPSFAHSPVG